MTPDTPLPPVTRRQFLKTAAAVTLAAPLVVPASVLGRGGQPPPSGRINLGIIGGGGMGQSNLRACAGQPDVVVTAACDVWPDRLDHIVNQFKPTCQGYRDFRELLRQPGLDAVIIATPPHWHALQAIAACEAVS
jgi:hypothetical protein